MKKIKEMISHIRWLIESQRFKKIASKEVVAMISTATSSRLRCDAAQDW
jgi:hypothetical protein